MNSAELQELVDQPNETLSAEYKSWLDLTANVDRANIARHIAALSNHGGGYVVFGFEDDMTASSSERAPKAPYTRDQLSAICLRYLDPAPQCDVQHMAASDGRSLPVVIVPPHGATPVCAKANGPEVNGKIVGIVQGTYYTRKTGPQSAPVLSPSDWAPIIRRCAMHDRSAILGALNVALQLPQQPPQSDKLKAWHEAAKQVFVRDVKAAGMADLTKRHIQYSYAITRSDDQQLDLSELVPMLEQVTREVQARVRTGWSMFYPFNRDPIAPYFATDSATGDDGSEFLECRLLREPDARHPDMWRVGADGLATLIRPYWEDDTEWNTKIERAQGSWLSPYLQFR